jgi:hypothetical protein
MRIGAGSGYVWQVGIGMLLAFAAGAAVGGQTARKVASSAGPQTLAGNRAFSALGVSREIEDAGTGVRWLLLRNESHPGGPGRLVPAGEDRNAHSAIGRGKDSVRQRNAAANIGQRPIICAGDRLIIRDDSDRVLVQLEGVALAPASVGSLLPVRLHIGGAIVRAVAVRSGQATLWSRMELQP